MSRCPSPLVQAGAWVTGNMSVGATVQYHCPLGHMPLGQTTQVRNTGMSLVYIPEYWPVIGLYVYRVLIEELPKV